MIIKANNDGHGDFGPITLRCHACGRDGTFETMPNVVDYRAHNMHLGQRRCPNRNCRAHVFVIINQDQSVIAYPPQRIDFDTTDVPKKVVALFDEALTCHANECYISSAIMVRRTLEEICNHKNASGKNLKDRIKSLSGKILIPNELIVGMDELRVLGNDAAHVQAQVYESIGKRELDVAIKFTKEILKAVYQYASLLKELQDLKKPVQTNHAQTDGD